MATEVLSGACHCGAVHWQFEGVPTHATVCNCTICRRYGVLWAYGHEGQDIAVTGDTTVYVQGDKMLGFHFCAVCGCVAYWRLLSVSEGGQRSIAVNLRLAEPELVGNIPINHFDGLNTFADLPQDGRCVADYWS